jgi:hypothetical protein
MPGSSSENFPDLNPGWAGPHYDPKILWRHPHWDTHTPPPQHLPPPLWAVRRARLIAASFFRSVPDGNATAQETDRPALAARQYKPGELAMELQLALRRDDNR